MRTRLFKLIGASGVTVAAVVLLLPKRRTQVLLAAIDRFAIRR